MRLLINISNNIGGGSFQVAYSFINECKVHHENEYIVVINSKVFNLFDINSFPNNFKFINVHNDSFFSLSRIMKKIEKNEKTDVVFTVFGPSYWKPKTPHLVGFANAYYILINQKQDKYLKKVFSKKEFHIVRLKKLLHTFYMNRDADGIVAETEYATEEFSKIFKNVKKFYTVSNTCSSFFYKELPCEEHTKTTLLTVCKYYKHKNLEIINSICRVLKQRNIDNIRFLLTIDDENYKRLFNNNSYVINMGYTKPEDCPSLYSKADIMFLPTLAECFSASYPEAMISGKPILTSDLPFAKSICQDAALYFDPLDENDIVNKILMLQNDIEKRNELVQKGKEIFASIPNAKERTNNYLEICSLMMKK